MFGAFDAWLGFVPMGDGKPNIRLGGAPAPLRSLSRRFAWTGAGSSPISSASMSSGGCSCFHDIPGPMPHFLFQIPLLIQVFFTSS
jgi:hypothetical protein